MAEKHDFLDDLIDIQSDWQALSHPLDALMGSLGGNDAENKPYDPADYKEQPWANPNRCLQCASGSAEVCRRCQEVWPVDAIDIHNQTVSIAEHCIQCGLCDSVCPTEVFNTRRHTPRKLYDQVARAASAYNKAYITCTRALGRKPLGNEICLPCVGAISRDTWFAILTDFDNVSVYLPFGVCDKCRTTTGETTYCDHIASAETWTGASVGFESDETALDHDLTRAYKRSQFLSSSVNAAERLVMRSTPLLAGAQAVANRINTHARALDKLQNQLDESIGIRTTNNRQAMLTQNRRLMMGALQHDEGLADFVKLEAPMWDSTRCTLCGECEKTCTMHAIDIDERGNLMIRQQFCTNCEACVRVCPEAGALVMQPMDITQLVVHDRQAEEAERMRIRARERAERLLETGKKQLGDLVESLEETPKDKD